MNLESGLFKIDRTETYKIYNQMNSYKTAERNTWVRASKENEEFELSKQWSQSESDLNKEKGNFTITINTIERMLEYITGMLSSKLPEYVVYPKNKSKESSTLLGKKLLSWVFEESRGLRRIRKWIHDGLAANLAFLFVYADDEGNIKFTNLDYEELIIDPGSKDFMFDDAKAVFLKKRMSVADAKAMYGVSTFDTGFPTEWTSAIGNGSSTVNPGDTTSTYDYANTEIGSLFSKDQTSIEIYERYSKIIDRDENNKVSTRIVKEILLGYDHIVREVLPKSISHYPFVGFYYKDTKNPYKIGKVHLVKEIQRFINKIHGVILKNTLTLGTPKVVVESTAIPHGNIEDFKRSLSDINGMVVINPSLDGRKTYDVIQGAPTPSAPMDLYMNALKMMEFNTVPNEMIGMGNTSNGANGNAAAMIFQKESVMDSFKTLAGIMEDGLERLGVIIMQFVKAYVKEDTIVYITDGESAIEKLELNKKHKLDFENPESIEAFKKKMSEEGVSSSEIESLVLDAKSNDEYAASIAEYIQNNTSDIDFYIKVVPGSYASMFESIKFQTLTMLVQMGSLHPSILIDYAPLDDKEKIKQKSNTMEKAFNEMRDMANQLEQISNEAQKVKEENAKLKEQMVEIENKARMDYLYKDARVKESKAKNDLNLSIKNTKAETSIKAKELLLQLREISKEMEEEGVDFSDEEFNNVLAQVDKVINNNL